MSSATYRRTIEPILLPVLLTAILSVVGYGVAQRDTGQEKIASIVAAMQVDQARLSTHVAHLSEVVKTLGDNQGEIRTDLATRKGNAFTAQQGNEIQLTVSKATALIAQNSRDIARNNQETRDALARHDRQVQELARRLTPDK